MSPASIAALGWLHGEVALALNPTAPSNQALLQLFHPLAHGAPVPTGRLLVPGRIRALDTHSDRLALAVERAGARTRLLASSASSEQTTEPPPAQQVLLELPAGTQVDALSIR